jgi:hypothetical protein
MGRINPEQDADIQNLLHNYGGSSFGSSGLLNALPVVAPNQTLGLWIFGL